MASLRFPWVLGGLHHPRLLAPGALRLLQPAFRTLGRSVWQLGGHPGITSPKENPVSSPPAGCRLSVSAQSMQPENHISDLKLAPGSTVMAPAISGTPLCLMALGDPSRDHGSSCPRGAQSLCGTAG